ncbi:alanine--tRNA ligase [Paraphotobacterium marinum]|uniref:alanine--tRNA ligase n=1 Tax=Paraphotobacterium marinum TaxID=1755811 RepID=UPI0039ED8448
MTISTNNLRKKFLSFFEKEGHTKVSSSSLVPQNDPSLLFTNAGMNQFKDVFLGKESRNYSKATSAQRCVRAGGKHNDLENVGFTARHHTFFEMMGNFSFGDYFKEEAIKLAWNFLTIELKLPEEKLLVTVYHDDQEAYDIWHNNIGLSKDKIIKIGDKGSKYISDNFWQMGDTGPCGPSTEIFYDHGPSVFGDKPGTKDEDGDRYIEIWNIVFMQYNRSSKGEMTNLPKPSVDTGMGLERLSAILQGVHSNYEIDIFRELIEKSGRTLGLQSFEHNSLKVIADHIRSITFLISDGVTPSNEGRGYVLRRIIRRAFRHGHKLGAKEAFLFKLVQSVIDVMSDVAKDIIHQKKKIESIIKREEENFEKTLDRGLLLLKNEMDKLSSGDNLSGDVAFKLYDTYGFPLDLTFDVLREKGLEVEEHRFNELMDIQKKRAKNQGKFNVNLDSTSIIEGKSIFHGYEQDLLETEVKEIFDIDMNRLDSLSSGKEAYLVLLETPFYAESGGQVGDTGTIRGKDNCFIVSDTQKIGNIYLHKGVIASGVVNKHEKVIAEIDVKHRNNIRLNHTATHLLHSALKQVIGDTVNQKGSLVKEDMLRFDFSSDTSLDNEQLLKVEDIVNNVIRKNIKVSTELMNIDDAKKKGALALFGEKYEEEVRVLSINDFSVELCGGTHVQRTGDIGLFKILSESGIASGIRRIEASTGEFALKHIQENSTVISRISNELKVDENTIFDKVSTLLKRNRSLEKEVSQLNEAKVLNEKSSLISNAVKYGDISLVVSNLGSVSSKSLKQLVDDIKNEVNKVVVVLACVNSGKISLVAGVSNNITQIIKAGDIVRYVSEKIGGKGGGRPDFAQAGGTDLASLKDALLSIPVYVEKSINSLN